MPDAETHGQPADQPDRDAPPAVRVRGRATAVEVAAVLAALGDRGDRPPRREVPPWLRAGLREGLGQAPAAEPSDLR